MLANPVTCREALNSFLFLVCFRKSVSLSPLVFMLSGRKREAVTLFSLLHLLDAQRYRRSQRKAPAFFPHFELQCGGAPKEIGCHTSSLTCSCVPASYPLPLNIWAIRNLWEFSKYFKNWVAYEVCWCLHQNHLNGHNFTQISIQ